MKRPMVIAVVKRLLVSLLLGLLAAWVVSEVSYQINRDPRARDRANRIELVIPAGTAERIANGESSVGIPNRMSFIAGDLLVLKNMDSVSHQLGPIWVPPQSSGVLEVGAASDYTYACSFSDTQTFGLEVRQELDLKLRMNGVVAMGVPTSVMLALYSILIFPIKINEEPKAGEGTGQA